MPDGRRRAANISRILSRHLQARVTGPEHQIQCGAVIRQQSCIRGPIQLSWAQPAISSWCCFVPGVPACSASLKEQNEQWICPDQRAPEWPLIKARQQFVRDDCVSVNKNEDIPLGKFRSRVAYLRNVVLRLSCDRSTQSTRDIGRRVIAVVINHDNLCGRSPFVLQESLCSVKTGERFAEVTSFIESRYND